MVLPTGEALDRPVDRPEIVGHGGAGAYFPGNSRASVQHALTLGVDRIEVDLQPAAGGELVLLHDDDVRMPDGTKRKTSGLPADRLRGLYPDLLTFDEVIALVGPDMPLMLDIKASGYESAVIAAIKKHGLAATCMVSSTYPATLRQIRNASPSIQVSLSHGHWANGTRSRRANAAIGGALRRTSPLALVQAARWCGAKTFTLQYRLATKSVVNRLHGLGFSVYVWTVDAEDRMDAALRAGVNGIISNRPDVALERLNHHFGLHPEQTPLID